MEHTVVPNSDGIIEVSRCATSEEYFALVNGPVMRPRWAIEHYIASKHQPNQPFALVGYCIVCRDAVSFSVEFQSPWRAPDGILIPNWRESVVCPTCKLSARQRIVAWLLSQDCRAGTYGGNPASDITGYIMEQRSPLYRWVADAWPTLNIVASEYQGSGPGAAKLQGAADMVRYEDAEHLTLEDASVDVFVSCDVFEHLDDPSAALSELGRVLRPGGTAILTFPMDPHLPASIRRAQGKGDQVEHLLPPIYHRDSDGINDVLVYHDFGWSILDEMRKVGLTEAALNVYWSYICGFLGIQFVFLASKCGE